MFNNLLSFGGRIRRREYALSLIFGGIALIFVYYWAEITRSGDSSIVAIFYIPIFLFFVTQGSKRCHDTGNSGWLQVIPFYIPWMIFKDGDAGSNYYGKNPKGVKKQYSSGSPKILDDGYEGDYSDKS